MFGIFIVLGLLIAVASMMMANANSNLIANREASPRTRTKASKEYGKLRIAADSIEVGGDIDADGDTIKLARVSRHAVPLELNIATDALDSGADRSMNLGIYDPDGSVQDEDCFGSGISDFQSATSKTDYRFDNADLDTNGQEMWELAGYSSFEDAPMLLDIVLTETATVGGAQDGTIAIQFEFAVE